VHIEFLVEEQSAEEALRVLVPRVAGPEVTFQVHSFRGKTDLLMKLPSRLRAYVRWIAAADSRVVVMIDEDRQDCRQLKARLEGFCSEAGLTTKTSPNGSGAFLAVNRIAVEELEAWFFGDCDAIRAAYPGVPNSLESRARYRHPDEIKGGTWEALERVLQDAGHHRGGLRKIEAAKAIAARMDPARNRSPSFNQFCQGVLAAATP